MKIELFRVASESLLFYKLQVMPKKIHIFTKKLERAQLVFFRRPDEVKQYKKFIGFFSGGCWKIELLLAILIDLLSIHK